MFLNPRRVFVMSWRMKWTGVATGLTAAILFGCGDQRPVGPQVFPVQGKLLFDGEPMAGARITLHRVGEAEGGEHYPRATTDEQGVYQLSTLVSEDGAPEGNYVMVVYWPDPKVVARDPYGEGDKLPPDLLRRRFATPDASNLRATIPDAPTRLLPVDLNDREVKRAAQFFLNPTDVAVGSPGFSRSSHR